MEHLQRGNKLWESHRMFLPEHKEALYERKIQVKKVIKPILEEDELEQLQFQLIEALHYRKKRRFHYYEDGKVLVVDGYVKKMHSIERWLLIEMEGLEQKIYLENILTIQ